MSSEPLTLSLTVVRGPFQHRSLLMACAIVYLSTVCSAYMRGYLPLKDAELVHRFPQQPIPINFEAGSSARFRTALILLEKDGRYSSLTVILDTKSGREAATLEEPEEARRLLEIIRDRKLSVQIMGRRRYAVTGDRTPKPTPCVPETVWAKEP